MVASITDGLGTEGKTSFFSLLSSWFAEKDSTTTLQGRRGFPYFEATREAFRDEQRGLLEGVVLVADLDRLLYRPAEQLGLDVDEVVVVVGSSLIRGDGGDGEPQVRALVVVLVKHTGHWFKVI